VLGGWGYNFFLVVDQFVWEMHWIGRRVLGDRLGDLSLKSPWNSSERLCVKKDFPRLAEKRTLFALAKIIRHEKVERNAYKGFPPLSPTR
tara:strand:- start:822 stop:1091 length:270 start_codon:yes stop_codon:yes gene_type:complete